MRKWLAWMLVLVFCLGGAAMAEETGFVFRNGVTWESTPEEVRQSESAEGNENEFDGWIKLAYYETSASKFTADLFYCFQDGEMYCCGYNFGDLPEGDREYLTKALSSKYGETETSDPEALRTLMCLMEPHEEELLDVQNWRLDDGTYIAMGCIGDRKNFFLLYFAEEKLLEWAGMFNTSGL